MDDGNIVAWGVLVGLLALIVGTTVSLGKKPLLSFPKAGRQMTVAWITWIGLLAITVLFRYTPVFQYIVEHMGSLWWAYALISVVLNWVLIFSVTVALVVTVRFVRTKKQTSLTEENK